MAVPYGLILSHPKGSRPQCTQFAEPHGAAALYLFVPSMAPMDVDERRGSVNPPCFLCGENNGDHMQHMACRCQSPLAVATRRAVGGDPRCSLRTLLAMTS